MATDYQQHFEASWPQWYKQVLACLRGEIPVEDVPPEYRYLAIGWRPVDTRERWVLPSGAISGPIGSVIGEAAPKAKSGKRKPVVGLDL